MDKSIKLLLTYLDDKSQDISDNDYLNGCNFLKEFHRENKELSESLYIVQKQLLILTCKVNDLENRIKNNNSNEEILNALHKKVDAMAECLNKVGLSIINDSRYTGETAKQILLGVVADTALVHRPNAGEICEIWKKYKEVSDWDF